MTQDDFQKQVLDRLDALTAVVDQTHHKKGRRAKPRNWFYIFICGGFESKLLLIMMWSRYQKKTKSLAIALPIISKLRNH